MAGYSKTAPRTIILRGVEETISKEGKAGGAITPGHLVDLNSSNAWVVHAVAAGASQKAFAIENDMVGKGIDDAYASGDWAQVRICSPGIEVYALVAAAATAIAAGDYVESAGDGTVRKVTAGNPSGTPPVYAGIPVGKALEAVDNSAGATPARIRIVIV